jgi:hypothetical protein
MRPELVLGAIYIDKKLPVLRIVCISTSTVRINNLSRMVGLLVREDGRLSDLVFPIVYAIKRES